MKLTDKISYLNGLVDGMDLDMTTKEGKVLAQIMEVLQTTALYVEDLQDQVDELTEVCESLDEDLADVEEIVYDEENDLDDAEYDDEDVEDLDDDDLYETVCPTCENTIVMDESVLDHGSVRISGLSRAEYGELLEFDFDDLDDAEDAVVTAEDPTV